MLDIIHGMFSPLKDGYFSYIDYVGEGRSVVQNSDMWLQRHRIQFQLLIQPSARQQPHTRFCFHTCSNFLPLFRIVH